MKPSLESIRPLFNAFRAHKISAQKIQLAFRQHRYRPGRDVIIRGLNSRVDLNGTSAPIVTRYDPKTMRIGVKLGPDNAICVKYVNVSILDDEDLRFLVRIDDVIKKEERAGKKTSGGVAITRSSLPESFDHANLFN